MEQSTAAPEAGPLWRIARHLGVYSIGSAISLACSFALLPVYATQFTAQQFGIVATGQVILAFALTLARVGINYGMFRYLAEYNGQGDGAGANRSVTTNAAASFLTSAGLATLMALFWVFAGAGKPAEILWSGYLIAATVVLSAPRESAEFAVRAKQLSRTYTVFTSATNIVVTALTAFAAVALHGGAIAVFGSAAVTNALMSVVGVWLMRANLRPGAFSLVELKRSLRYGLPGVPAVLADWVMQFSDRLFLTRFAGLAQAGVYSLGYRIGMIEQQILGTATNAAWDPFILHEYRVEGGLRSIGRVATYFAIIGMALVLFISASAPILLTVIHARPEYFAATSVVFLVALANFFATIQHMLAAPTSIRLRPELDTAFRGGGALLNIALNLALIPTFGMMGAAWATLATYVASAAVTLVVSRRLLPIVYEYGKLASIVAGGVGVWLAVILAQAAAAPVLGVLSPIWAVLLFAAWLIVTGAFSVDEVQSVVRRLRSAVAQ